MTIMFDIRQTLNKNIKFNKLNFKYKFSFVEILIGICFISLAVVFLAFSKFTKTPPPRYPILIKNIDSHCDSIVGPLKESIQAGMALDISTGEIFWEYNSDKTCEIASLTKMMVELIAMEKIESGEINMEDTVIVTNEASRMDGSRVYLSRGEKILLKDLLKATLVYSANDASYMTGQYIGGGSKDCFVKMMNRKAWEMGLRHTYFGNPTGLPAKHGEGNNISNCMDLAQLGMQVIKYSQVRIWMGMKLALLRDGEFVMRTRNTLMRHCDLVDGLKTGYYPKAGYNIVATSLKGDRKIMVIVLGSKSRRVRDKVARNLIEYAAENHTTLASSK